MWLVNAAVCILMITQYYRAKARGQTFWMVGFAFFAVLNFAFSIHRAFN